MGRIIQLLIDHAQMIAVGGICGHLFYSIFEERCRNRKRPGVEVSPAQSIGGVRRIGHAAPGGLS